MVFIELLFVLIVTVLLTTVFAVGFLRRTTRDVLVPFFIILFLATWATGIWITPVGPVVRGIYWMPFLTVAILYALLLTALIPPAPRPRNLREEVRQEEQQKATVLVLNRFFWILIVGLIVAITIRYLYIHS